MKARRNRIRRHARKGRLRMESNPAPAVAWVRDRFLEEHSGPGPIGTLRRPFRDWLQERLRILGWILRLLRR